MDELNRIENGPSENLKMPLYTYPHTRITICTNSFCLNHNFDFKLQTSLHLNPNRSAGNSGVHHKKHVETRRRHSRRGGPKRRHPVPERRHLLNRHHLKHQQPLVHRERVRRKRRSHQRHAHPSHTVLPQRKSQRKHPPIRRRIVHSFHSNYRRPQRVKFGPQVLRVIRIQTQLRRVRVDPKIINPMRVAPAH